MSREYPKITTESDMAREQDNRISSFDMVPAPGISAAQNEIQVVSAPGPAVSDRYVTDLILDVYCIIHLAIDDQQYIATAGCRHCVVKGVSFWQLA